MRFLADENVSRLVIERLRRRGFEVVSIGQTQSGTPDEDVLKLAHAEDCIVIPENRGFGEWVVRQRLGVRASAPDLCRGNSKMAKAPGADEAKVPRHVVPARAMGRTAR